MERDVPGRIDQDERGGKQVAEGRSRTKEGKAYWKRKLVE